jgi:hypothetical protein
LEKQALGCLSKAFAVRNGEQSSPDSAAKIGTDWIRNQQTELYEKINIIVENVRIKSGITLGGLPYHLTDSRTEHMYTIDEGGLQRARERALKDFPIQGFYEPSGIHEFMEYHRENIASAKEHF